MKAYVIDREQTEKIDKKISPNICDCSDCQYFYKYMDHLCKTGCEFFEKNGLNPLHIQELWAYYPDDNGVSHYSGYFYIALAKHPKFKGYIITDQWASINFGRVNIRFRYEYLLNSSTVMGFECDLPTNDPIINIDTRHNSLLL